MVLGLPESRSHLPLIPSCYGGEEPPFSWVSIYCHSSIRGLKDERTFSLQMGVSPACGAASAGRTGNWSKARKGSERFVTRVVLFLQVTSMADTTSTPSHSAQEAALETMRHHAREAHSLTHHAAALAADSKRLFAGFSTSSFHPFPPVLGDSASP